MNIKIQPDVENVVRETLDGYVKTYCRPLPKSYDLPNVLVQQTGGTESNTVDTVNVAIDCRATTEAEAQEKLREAVGILRAVAHRGDTVMRYVAVTSMMSWGTDPVRPDLAMCSATLTITTHEETKVLT
jgi:hypothetical protein